MKIKLVTLVLLLISAGSFAQTSADAEAVKKACINLSTHYDQRDLPALLIDLAPVSYASRYWTNNAYNGDAAIRELAIKTIEASPTPTGMKRETSNWQLQPLGSTHYWATYSQAITRPDGTTKYEKEVRLLEKIAGQWKTVSFITLPMTKAE